MIPSNYTIEEILSYVLAEEEANAIRERMDDVLLKAKEQEEELREAESRIERLEEQLYFANELIENIEIYCKDHIGRKKELIQYIRSCIEESSFER